MKPVIHASAFIAKTAQIWGDVEVQAGASIWFGAVLRGDEGKIIIGEGSNIQDNCVLHSDLGARVIIGKNVTVGHGSVIRGCQIGDETMIGMNCTVMSGVSIGENCVVGAHSLITYGQEFDDNSLIMGVPAKCAREATKEERQFSRIACDVYSKLVVEYEDGSIEPYAGGSASPETP